MSAKRYEEEYFGNCPVCHLTNGAVHRQTDNGVENWFVCYEHKLRWQVGVNLFRGLWDLILETEPDYPVRATERLKAFREIPLDETWCPPAQVAETLLNDVRWMR